MATILNDRDKALQAAPYRSKLAAVTITGTASAFLASKNTVTISPATITLTATPAGSVYSTSAVYTWAYALSSAPNTWVALGTGANLKTQVLNNTDSWVANAFVQYKCVVTEPLLDTSYAYYTVTYTKEASDPTVINLSRSNILVTCDSTGTPTSYSNTDQVITVSRGTNALAYSLNTTTPNSFTVAYVASNLTAGTGTGSGNTWTQQVISAIALDGATIIYTITVYDSATVPTATTYTKTVVYNKVNNGVIGAAGADGANLYPVVNYDFTGALPSGVTFPGTVTNLDIGTATTIQNTVADQNLRLTNLSLVPANSYIISMRVKFISGTWEGTVYYSNTTHVESGSYFKTIPQPAIGVWTTINVDMRALTVGGTDYLSGGNISQLRFDFINDITSQVAIDYISVGKYGVAEATKSITLSMYQWATSAPAYTGAFTYTWNTGNISAVPTSWTLTAGTAPGNGYTLYQRNIIIIDVGTAATTTANWNTSTVNTVGYRNDGSIGVQGDSARTAYAVTTGAWATPTSPTSNAALAPTNSITITGTTVTTNIVTISTPVPLAVGTKLTLTTGTNFGGLFAVAVYYVKSFISSTQITLSTTADLAAVVAVSTATGSISGTTNSWSLTATPTLVNGQYMYQSDGILNNSSNIIAWGVPYLSNLKVGNLSAISANLGVVSIASGGALYSGKTSYSDTGSSGFFLGNDGGYAKFRIGTADNSSSLGYDSSTGILTLKGGSYLNSSGTTLFTPTTLPSEIQNSAISISGLGYSGALDANKTYVDNNGAIQGVSSGVGTAVSNALVETLNLISTSTMVINGNTLTKVTTAAAAWNAQVYSKDSYIGGAYIRFVPLETTNNIMAGLNTDPSTSASYTNINYAWYLNAGILKIYESGTEVVITGGAVYATSDVLSITYDGTKVSYYKNGGTPIRTVTVAITSPLYFDSSFNQNGASIGKVAFGPLTSNAWGSIGGTGRPDDYATVGATIDNMTVAVGANILPNSDFSNALTNWSINLNPQPLLTATGVNFNNASTLNSGVGDNSNTAYIKHTNLLTDTIDTTEFISDPIPITYLKRYVYSGYIHGQNCTVNIRVDFYNSAGTIVGTGTESNSIFSSTTPILTQLRYYTRVTGFVTASVSTATTVRIKLTKQSTVTNVTASSAYFTRIMLQEGGTVATVAGPWSASGSGKAVVASIATAGTTSTWTGVSGVGRPEDNATVGANASNLQVGTGNNICPNSDFTSIANWTLNNVTIISTLGLNLSTTWTLNQGNGEGTGTIYLFQNNGTSIGYSELYSDPIVVVPGNTYFLSGYSGAHRCNVIVLVNYYKTDGTPCTIQNSTGTNNGSGAYVGGKSLIGYYKHKEKIIPPTGCAYVKVILRKEATFAGIADQSSYLFVTRVMFEETGPSAVEPGNWCAPGVGKIVVASIAAAKAAADAANLAAANKLNKYAADTMTGPITLSAENAITVGNPGQAGIGGQTGFYIGSTGIVATKDGAGTLIIGSNGDALFKGNISGSTGTFLGNVSGGQFTTGAFTGYSWPAINNYGSYFGPSGLLLGNANNGNYFQVTTDGDVYTQHFRIQQGVMTLFTANVVKTLNIGPNSATSMLSAFSAGSNAALVLHVDYAATVQVVGNSALPTNSNIYLRYRNAASPTWITLAAELLHGGATGALTRSVYLPTAGDYYFDCLTDYGVRTSVIVFASIR